MKTYSETQRLLLKQLGIVPLAAKAEFFSASAASASSSLIVPLQSVPASCLLAADIHFLLEKTSLTDWVIAPNADVCRVEAQRLLTPDMAALQHKALKQQLWQLLSEHLHD